MENFAWILKTEPGTYGWDDLLNDEVALWDGVRNYRARNFMKEMKPGQKALIYHSGKSREIVGIAEVVNEAFQDPTDQTGKFVAINVKAIQALTTPISLAEIKEMPIMQDSLLLRQTRLSVIPVTEAQYNSLIRN